MINLLINAQSLSDYHRTGVSYYTWHLLNGLLNHQDINSLYAYDGNLITKHYPTSLCIKLSNFFLKLLNKTPVLGKKISNYYCDFFESFSKKLNQQTIYHEPNFIVKTFNGLCITTLHDITCLRYPQLQPEKSVEWFMRGVEKTLHQANHIISVSEFTRDEAIRHLGINPKKITTIHNGVSKEFHPRSEASIQGTLKKYQLNYNSYILSVCTIEPRKNLDNLLKGYLILPKNLRKKFPLVLVGAIGWKVKEFVDAAKENSDDVKMLGYVSDKELKAIFSGAKIFAYLSTYEGFGLPVLEALASGVPVLTSAQSAMSEFSKDQALLINPLDVDAITRNLNQLIEDDSFEKRAMQLADYYRENYSWEKNISQTLAVYKKIISEY